MLKTLSILSLIMFFFTSCSEKEKEIWKTVKSIKVKGTCKENHVGLADEYKGSITHSINETKNNSLSYGRVFRTKILDNEDMIKRITNQSKYHTPNMIKFENVSLDIFSKTSFELIGVSIKGTNEENGTDIIGFESTCNLFVIDDSRKE